MQSLLGKNRNYNLVALLGGTASGTLTASLICIGSLFGRANELSGIAIVRLGLISALSGLFSFLLSHYVGARDELLHAEKQLNLTTSGRLASSMLGRKILYKSIVGALLTGTCSFVCFTAPLLLAHWLQAPDWAPFALVVVMILMIAYGVARVMHTRAPALITLILVGFVICILFGMLLKYG